MSGTRVLIVEDQSVIALDLKARLAALGYVVSGPVSTGEAAIQQAALAHPDVILMDIILKGQLDGVDAAARIRESLGIPVIYLTAHSDEQTLQRARVTEPHGYILKPFEDREVVTAIEMALYKHSMERKLKQTERWLAAVLRSIGDAVIATDAEGRITFMNPVAEALTGRTQADAIGLPVLAVFNIYNEATGQPVPDPIEQALRRGQLVTLPPDTTLRHGERRVFIEDTVAPIRDDAGQITGGVIIFKDITERKRHETEMRRINAELQARNEELDAFAHTLAHDLKNSVHLVGGFAELLARDYGGADADLQFSVKAISRTARKLNNIIEEILLLAVVRSTEMPPAAIKMQDVVAEAQLRLSDLIQQQHAEIVCPDMWPEAYGHAPWVEEIWINYLSNAIKYGGRPPQLELGGELQADGTARFWVHDNGNGIPPDKQAQLFKPFTQLAPRRVDGQGLGLSIVRRIADKLGGTVSVHSTGQPGSGSTFYFTLPAQPNTPFETRSLVQPDMRAMA